MDNQPLIKTKKYSWWLLAMAMTLLAACQPMELRHLEERQGRYYPAYETTPYSGKVVIYFDEDQSRVYQSGELASGLKEGVWTINHWNGETEEIAFSKGVRHGLASYYYTGGRVKQTQNYQDGRLHGAGYVWSPEGRMVRHTQHEEGNLVLLSEAQLLSNQNDRHPFTPAINLLADLFPPNG